MVLKTFVLYFFMFLVIYTFGKRDSLTLKKLFIFPGIFALIMVFLTVVKIFFLYKLFLLLILGFITLLTYLQWGQRIRRWFNE